MNYIFGVRRVWQWLAVAVLAAGGCGQKAPPASDFAAKRHRMVEQQLTARGINNERVLAAMANFLPQLSLQSLTRSRNRACLSG